MQYWLSICLVFLTCSCTTHDSAQQRGYVITQSHIEPEALEAPDTEKDQP